MDLRLQIPQIMKKEIDSVQFTVVVASRHMSAFVIIACEVLKFIHTYGEVADFHVSYFLNGTLQYSKHAS